MMLAVLNGHLDTAVQLALSGANLAHCDAEGRTALELAVLSSNRQVRNMPLSRLYLHTKQSILKHPLLFAAVAGIAGAAAHCNW